MEVSPGLDRIVELSSLVVMLFADVRFDAMVGDFGGDGDAE
jgi:hypothetical protein